MKRVTIVKEIGAFCNKRLDLHGNGVSMFHPLADGIFSLFVANSFVLSSNVIHSRAVSSIVHIMTRGLIR